jgi:hypothetical protein
MTTTRPAVMRVMRTQPGTSPRSGLCGECVIPPLCPEAEGCVPIYPQPTLLPGRPWR